MDQLIYASLSHTHHWYEVGMLKVCMYGHHLPQSMDQPGKVTKSARGRQLNRENEVSLLQIHPW